MRPTTSGPLENDLLELERRFWDAIKNRDSRTAARLSDDHCLIVGPQGVADIDKQTLSKMVEGPTSQLKQYQFDDREVHIRVVSKDVAIIAYKVREDLVVSGTPLTMQAFDTSVWVRRDGAWVCALHTETLPGDPYGRPS